MALVSWFNGQFFLDKDGTLLGTEQETATWDVINKHYLRAPGPVFLEEPLEHMSDGRN